MLPGPLFSKLVDSAQTTMALSNIPGPNMRTSVAGFDVKNITFWIPNRASTGIGLSILSYGGKLQLGLMADCAAILKLDDAQCILENMVDEIKHIAANLRDNSIHSQKFIHTNSGFIVEK